MPDKDDNRERQIEQITEGVAVESFKLCLWVINMLEMSHKAGSFDVGVSSLRKGLGKQLIQAQAQYEALKAEGGRESA